jgi:hypothetical protein
MPEAAGGKNAYFCEACHRYIVTVNLVQGTTPMFLSCRATEGCTGRMTSCMYPPHPWPEEDGFGNKIPKEVTHEWYIPVSSEFNKLTREGQEHVQKGGLLLRQVASD